MTSSAWNAVVVPSTPLMISRLGAADLAQIGTTGSSSGEISTPSSRSVSADPLGDVRALAVDAVRWLVSTSPSRVVVLTAPADPANVARGVTSPLGERVARALLDAAGFGGKVVVPQLQSPDGGAFELGTPELGTPGAGPRELVAGDAVLVVGDGSARRGEKAPGHLDERAHDYDVSIEKALASCSAADLVDLSPSLGQELLAAGVPAFRALGGLPGAEAHSATMDYADDPLGVQYWIVRWTCAS